MLAGSVKPTPGSHIYNRELIRRLAARGHRVSVVSFDDGDEDWDEIEITCLPLRDWDAIPRVWRFAATLQGLQGVETLRRHHPNSRTS